ncbi:hypothetical protein LEP1GSC112_0165 [Leptospira interrogans serovar Pomona str. UT364]|nr:hypothetical protein LEP1GSC112_0165 [Leptospira interrogans serovar Pomona str. UT364]
MAGLTAASFIVGCTALAVATVAGFAATGAVYTAIGLGAFAIGVALGVGGVLFASAAAAARRGTRFDFVSLRFARLSCRWSI